MAEIREEIEALHAFFVAWFNGDCAEDDRVFAEGLLDRLAPEFYLIQPSGEGLDGPAIAAAIGKGYGKSQGFRIQVRNVEVRPFGGADLVVATYQEWQRNAVNSTPPDNGRVATVLFRRTPAGRLAWLHVHETWLPPEMMARRPFDF